MVQHILKEMKGSSSLLQLEHIQKTAQLFFWGGLPGNQICLKQLPLFACQWQYAFLT